MQKEVDKNAVNISMSLKPVLMHALLLSVN